MVYDLTAIDSGRLIATAIIYYDSAILARLLDKYQTTKSSKALTRLKKNLAG